MGHGEVMPVRVTERQPMESKVLDVPLGKVIAKEACRYGSKGKACSPITLPFLSKFKPVNLLANQTMSSEVE